MTKLPAPGTDPYDYPGHSGIDVLRGPAHRGKPILASGPGVVLRTPKTLAGGYWTTVKYDMGATIGYAHQDKLPPVKAGDRVWEGRVIGYVGATGARVTGPHVHLERIGKATPAGVREVFDFTRKASAQPAAPAGGSKLTVTVKRAVADIQRLVGAKADGRYGIETRTKVAAWQKAHGLKADGVWGPASDAKGFPVSKPQPAAPARIVKLGSRGDLVRAVQHKLKTAYALYAGKLTVDGIAGAKTIAAIKEFQRRAGLKVDGIAGAATLARLGV